MLRLIVTMAVFAQREQKERVNKNPARWMNACELQSARVEGKPENIAKKQAKLDEAQAKLQEAQREPCAPWLMTGVSKR
ncbi:DUF1090 family protein [Aeromonas sp. A-5]|uniref:DUF1090 family protein n=1 Tax=Aeromonas ichthyocola TaxID=3367746 RepID=UPI0038E5FC11